MQEDFRGLLLAEGAITTLVGSRITWNERPQASALPAIVLTIAGEDRAYAYDGDSSVATRVQVDIYASSYASAVAIDRAAVMALSGRTATRGATQFMGIFFESRFDAVEEDEKSAQRVQRISRDLIIHHKETEA